jgi:hypothetical protein
MEIVDKLMRYRPKRNVLNVIPGRCEASNPESRDFGFALSRAPE